MDQRTTERHLGRAQENFDEQVGDGARSQEDRTVAKKKTLVASEQDRPDVVEKREQFRRAILDLKAGRLIFIDETGVNLAMTSLLGRAPRGQRARFKRPAARGTNVSVVGALSGDGIIAFDAKDGAYDGARFMMFLTNKLVPQLRSGDVVFMDNVRFHRIADVRTAIEATGATLEYLPPYSPELNPIEEAWSFFKNWMRRAAARDLSTLVDVLVQAMGSLSKAHASAFIKHAGYSAQLS